MINSTQRQILLQKIQPQQVKRNAPAVQEMMSSFEKMIGEVNQSQIEAESMISETIAGKNKNVAGTMIAMEKADVSMRMLMTVRNKMISAYEEIMRMQV
ncbi:MAG: flagellar hook-basal body complex protein FliE [Proteobacteria bacterium]|nr:flagellar hook-basal body complex protein FliE [Pseudomonadota bacterium]